MNLVSISTMKKKEEIDDYIENFNLNVGQYCLSNDFYKWFLIFSDPIDYSKWSEQIWTSGNDFGHEGDFFWMGNGKGVHLSNWIETDYVDKSAPDNTKRVDAKDSCIAMWNYNGTGFLWNYHVCSNTFYFLCETSTD